jgi:hypothetical protein
MIRPIYNKKRFWIIVIFVSLMLILGFLKPRFIAKNENVPTFAAPPKIFRIESSSPEIQKVWPVPDMDKMKRKGCVADGLLSGYNRTSKDIQVAQRSDCYFFSRAIETWLDSPDFKKAREIMAEIGRDDVQYGMFIAEALNKKENYIYYEENRRFNFDDMCKSGSKKLLG